jgi:hypothetical protein
MLFQERMGHLPEDVNGIVVFVWDFKEKGL